jgi:hypothetical protein
MTEDLPVSNEQFPPARVKKSKLISIQSKLLKKFSIKDREYRLI